MSINEIIRNVGAGTLVIFTLIQIAPIKINPWSCIGRFIGKAINSELIDKVDDLSKRVDDLSEDCEKREAITVRNRILRFSDEIYHGIYHSKESFDCVLSDVTFYERYCEKNPEFKNHMTVIATKQIEDVYRECLANNKFI